MNLTCNIENEEISNYLVLNENINILELLRIILLDQRKDWPTNGASLALLQYAHKSLNSQEFYIRMEDMEID